MFPFWKSKLNRGCIGYNDSCILFNREKERNELKSKIEELEAFRSKYEEEKQQKEVGALMEVYIKQ
jgi:predicted DNA-binding protein (UPF0251 family)